jgi:predicted Zn-dependent protease with MMP-like domain
MRTRAEEFADAVEEAIDHLASHRTGVVDGVDFVIEEVPPETGAGEDLADPSGVPLAAVLRGPDRPTVVFYRRPVELRAGDPESLPEFVYDVVVEAVAKLTGIDPDTLDPGYFE